MAADVALTDAADGDTVAESTEEPLTDVTDSGMDDIANGEYVTFDMFDGTRMDVNHWGNVLLDGVREISMDEIDRVDSSEKTKKMPAFRIQHTRIIILTATIHSG